MTNDATAAPDLSRIVLRLRDDLTFTPQIAGGKQLYVVEDRLSGKCYRVGFKEYTLAKSLDGQATLAEVAACLKGGAGEPLFSESEVLQVCRWLLTAGLVQPAEQRARSAETPSASSGRTALANPIFIRIPLLSPDDILERLTPWLGWVNSPAALVLTGTLWLVAAVHLATGWDRFVGSASNVFSLDQGFYLLLCWTVLKVLHEIGHGLACKYYGGYVREAGVALLLFAPIPYVDVTSSWRLRSKWARIHIAAAGMIVEAVVGALAVLVWSYAPAGVASQLCVNVIMMATATTLLFNANPLMRFDGYYMLTDLLELPNLYTRGQQFTSLLARRWLLGDPAQPDVSSVVRWYGLAAWCWRVMVCVSLIAGAAALFHGAGIVVAAMAIFSWFIVPAYRLARRLCAEPQGKMLRPLGIIAVTGLVLGALLSYTPWPFPARSPGVVEYEPLSIVRARSPGFIREVLVVAGQRVAEGQLLARLENPELGNQLELLRLSVEESELRRRMYRQRGEMAAYQAETEQLAALKTQLAEKQDQVSRLMIFASAGGHVIGRVLPHLEGTYLSEGDELCRIGAESAKELQLSIHQDDVASFQQQVGERLSIRGPNGLIRASLTRISPRASEKVSHLALCATHGGPLPVRQPADAEASDQVVLIEPRFVGHVILEREHSQQLLAGQLCTAMVPPDDSVGAVLARRVRRWVTRKAATN